MKYSKIILASFSIFFSLFTLYLLLTAPTTLAQGVGGGARPVITLTNPLGPGANTVGDYLTNVIIPNLKNYIVPPIVVGMVLFGAFQILFAGGDPEKFQRGKKTILYAVIGYAVVFLSSAVSTLFTNTNTTLQNAYNKANIFLGYMQTFFWVIATAVVILSAFKFLTSGADEKKVTEAKKMLWYAVIAIAVALLSTAVVGAVNAFLS